MLVLLMGPGHQADCATQPTECLLGWAWLHEQPIHPPFFSKMAAGHQHQSELLCWAAARFGPTHDTRDAACIAGEQAARAPCSRGNSEASRWLQQQQSSSLRVMCPSASGASGAVDPRQPAGARTQALAVTAASLERYLE